MDDAVSDILAVPVSQLCPAAQQLLVLEHTATVAEALQGFASAQCLSAPVTISNSLEDMESGDADAKPSFLGWIDISNILDAFLSHLTQDGKQLPTKMLHLMTVLETEGPSFGERMIVTISGTNDRSLVYSANSNVSLLHALRELFMKHQQGGFEPVHRLAIFDALGFITSIISQVDVIRYLLGKVPNMKSVAQQSLEELGLLNGKPPVFCVSPQTPTLLAFREMRTANVSGAAVTSETGALMANLSISDLRCMRTDHLSVLALPVAEFLALLHNTAYMGYSVHSSQAAQHPFFAGNLNNSAGEAAGGAKAVRPITCTPRTSLHELLQTLVANRVHRVYVVSDDEQNRPQAVITPTDLLRMFAGVW